MRREYCVEFFKTSLAATTQLTELGKLGWRVVSTAADSTADDPGLWVVLEKEVSDES